LLKASTEEQAAEQLILHYCTDDGKLDLPRLRSEMPQETVLGLNASLCLIKNYPYAFDITNLEVVIKLLTLNVLLDVMKFAKDTPSEKLSELIP